jgi:hypothetical protein
MKKKERGKKEEKAIGNAGMASVPSTRLNQPKTTSI